ncbi:MAG: TerC family protein [Verrucomicrobiae bacterium]|nr:TerC family protein [Verrucomicrobiae bacterium]
METPISFWIAFHGIVFAVLAVDLCRKPGEVSFREASVWTAIWVALSLAFNAVVWRMRGTGPALEFLTGYVVEYSLSVDNVLVFVLIMDYFRVPGAYQHRVLFWGVFGAIMLRGGMIALGVALVQRFHWILYLFGIFLVVTGIKMFLSRGETVDLKNNRILALCQRWMPLTPDYRGAHFLAREGGRWLFTPLALVMVFVNFIDLVFAVDSIPAIFAITRDGFIVYTSNICAILGLRSLYFLISGAVQRLVHLKTGLALVLFLVGVKMLIADWWAPPIWGALLAVLLILGASAVASLVAERRKRRDRLRESPSDRRLPS